MAKLETVEIPITGMDCAECTQHVRHAIARLEGVRSVEVLLGSEKAIVQLDPGKVGMPAIRRAVASAGEYSVPEVAPAQAAPSVPDINRRFGMLLASVFSGVLFIVIAGEWLGLFDVLKEVVPLPIGVAVVVVAGWPIYRKVIRATLSREIISHTLMTVGVLAALAIGEWVTALIVAIFMRVGDYVESFTTESARRAVKELSALAPQTARIEQMGLEVEVPIAEVRASDLVIVRPGEKIPVDGEVISGQATVDQGAITGESMPVEVARESEVFAATIVKLGSLRIRTIRTGPDTTFGRVIKMVENAEANRGVTQRFADKFSGYYFPIVAGIAAITFVMTRNALATAAVLVVACSCSIALATPIAMLASIGSGARRGLLIKGGKYLESLARADIVLVDKTGTLTLGQPRITDVIPLNGLAENEILALAAAAEKYSEHPLGEAIRATAQARNLPLSEPEEFEAIPGMGVRVTIQGRSIEVGNQRLIPSGGLLPLAKDLEGQGKTVLFLSRNREIAGILAAEDTIRPEVPASIRELCNLSFEHIELLTGDNERVASALAKKLGVSYRAELLPENKIEVVREYQSKGHTVVMIGDGINDAPALAQADVGIAMGVAGTDIAIEVADIVLLREDWMLVPQAIRTARRTMKTVRMNLAFTAVYNVLGLSLAAFGILPPVYAAAAQSLPDLGILANSARLLRG
ncbi:MAG TPA: cation-translocating P-type ATPase [Anaerolineales bacterium]|nr:cation-translocating P-type ATPase [Anaerolineales bacterium]